MEVVMSHHDRLDIPEGFYLETICHSDWVIPGRYTDLQNVGSGAYGSVCSAKDNENEAVRVLLGNLSIKKQAQRQVFGSKSRQVTG